MTSSLQPLSVIADNIMTVEPSLYDQLVAVKPAGLSTNAWATKAGVNRSVFQNIRQRGNASWDTIRKLLDAVGLTQAEFEAGMKAVHRDAPADAVRAPRMAFQGDDRPRDVPVLGTAECGDVTIGQDGHAVEVETMSIDHDDVIDRVRRPVSLDNRRDVYAIYFRGQSMSPRYEDGEIAYIDPRRPASRLDYVILQLVGPDGDDGERVIRVLAKRLLKTTASHYEVEQFNPPLVFRVPRKSVRHMHRIMDLAELVAF